MSISMINSGNTQTSLASLNQSTLDTQRILSNGLKSDQTKNNATKLAIADHFATQVQGLNRSIQNINDGIASSQLAKEGLQTIQENIQRIQELAIQSANDTLNSKDRQNLQQEANQLQKQIASTISTTQYNGTPLLSTGQPITLQAGPNPNNQITLALPNLTNALANVNLATQAGANSAIQTLSSHSAQISKAQGELAASQNGLASTANALLSTAQSLTEASGRIINTDIAQAASATTSAAIRSQASVAIQAQANQSASQVQALL